MMVILASMLLLIYSSVDAAERRKRFDKESYIMDVELASGLQVRHVVYRREPLGGWYWLDIRRGSGLIVVDRDGRKVSQIASSDFDELIHRLMIVINQEHSGKLQSVRVDLSLISELWDGSVKNIRGAGVAYDYRLEPKSELILATMKSYLSGNDLVKRVCEQVVLIDKKCKKNVAMNPVVFRSVYLWQKWGDVVLQPDAGMDRGLNWFSIDVEDAR